jgi:hypothetical protein
MRRRMGWFLAAVALLTASGCTSSGHKADGPAVSFEARPLVMPGQHVTTPRADPFGSLRPPPDETAFAKLDHAQQADLANALRAVDCVHPPHLANSRDRIACDADSDAFLVGAPLFTARDVKKADTAPPSASVPAWRILLTLTSAAAKTMYDWTFDHHVASQTGAFNDVQMSATPPCGPTMATRCSYFTAYITDNRVVTLPVSFAAVGNVVVIFGDFGKAFAVALAHKLSR